MIRVCGITFDHTTNYGSCLQAYALQTAIEKMEIDGEKCSYHLTPLRECTDYSRRELRSELANLYLDVLHRPPFVSFENCYMSYSIVQRLSELGELNDSYDAFVCGSDVIWNPTYNLGHAAYYLGFAQKYAFSYAASIGKATVTDVEREIFKRYLPKLDAIAVRKESTAQVIQECVDKPVRIVADPVLLLDTDEWDQIAGEKKSGEKYIFAYATHLSENYLQCLKKLQAQTGLKVIRAAWKPSNAVKQGIFFTQSPQKWLQQLRDAQYVVTNSFHATVFATMYHKKFFTVVKGKKNETINVRMNDFLERVGLADRILSEVPENIDTATPDFSTADRAIEEMRRESLDYLRSNLEAAYQQKLELENKEKINGE